MNNNSAQLALREIGLNQLEAEVYLLLLRKKPMTAYQVGKLLNKPTANIYKAVESLGKRGALVLIEGKSRLCKAVDYQEFCAVQARRFEEKIAQASQALSLVESREDPEEETYSLDSVDLALEKARQMIREAKVTIVADAFPLTLLQVQEELKSAVARGVKISIQAYSEFELAEADVLITPNHNDVVNYWQSQQLNLVVDGQSSLVALFDQHLSKVFHATWSTNVYLSCILHAGRVCEQTVHKLMALPNTPYKLAQVESILEQQSFFRNSDVPGVKWLFKRHLSSPPQQ